MSNFSEFDFNISHKQITSDIISNIDNISEKHKYTDDDCDVLYLFNKYNDDSIGLNKSIIYYGICCCIVHKINYYGILHLKTIDLYKLFENLSKTHIEIYLNDKGLYYIFEGLIKYDSNCNYGIEKIKQGVELLKVNNNKIYLSGDFLYGANLIKKNPDDLIQMNIDYNNRLNDNFILKNDNIETLICQRFDYTDVYINFTTDIIYFMSFASSLIEIVKKTYLDENIRNIGFFWNIIIDKQNYKNKKLMNDFIVKSQLVFEYFRNQNSIITLPKSRPGSFKI